MSTWNIILIRTDPLTQEELQRETVMGFEDAVTGPAPTLGGTMLALEYTTTVVTVPNGDAFDFVMHRNDPYTEAFISDTTILEGFVEDPDGRYTTAGRMQDALRSNIRYIADLLVYSRATAPAPDTDEPSAATL